MELLNNVVDPRRFIWRPVQRSTAIPGSPRRAHRIHFPDAATIVHADDVKDLLNEAPPVPFVNSVAGKGKK